MTTTATAAAPARAGGEGRLEADAALPDVEPDARAEVGEEGLRQVGEERTAGPAGLCCVQNDRGREIEE